MRKLTLTTIGLISTLLLSFAAGAGPAQAEPSPVHDPALSSCEDELVRTLYTYTGWRGKDLRIAWSIAMRESHGDPTLVSGEDHGLFQLNTTGWADTPYWPADVLDGPQNAAAAYAMWNDFSFIPWGHNADGSTNAEHYPNWTKKQIRTWITKRFRDNYKNFPDTCKPWLKLN